MAEWPKAHDWKSCIPLKGIEGSNPSLSANNNKARLMASFIVIPAGKGFEPEEREFDKDERRTEVRRRGKAERGRSGVALA